MKEVQETDEEKKKLDKNNHNLQIDQVQTAWADYAKNYAKDAPTLKSAMETAELKLEKDNVLRVIVSGNLYRDSILTEERLLSAMKKELQITRLSFEIEVDKSRAPQLEQAKASLTLTDIYEHLKTINPEINTFFQQLKFKRDS